VSRKHKKHQPAGDVDPSKPAAAEIKTLGRSKKRWFTIVLILLPFLLLALAETCLRAFGYGEDTRLFITAPGAYSDYYRVNPKVARRFFYMQSVLPAPQKDLFLKKKPENCFRIFVLGESTTAGFPYGNNVMFPRILNVRLADAFPGRRIEVVNMGMAAISSYAMLDFMNEILDQKPDALLVYAGHNEFYGAMAVSSMESLGRNPAVVRAYLRLERLKLFMALRDAIGKFRVWMILKKNPDANRNQNVTLMERIVSDETIPLHGPVYEKGRKQFESNLAAIADRAKRRGVPVLIGELASNVRDLKPFSSAEGDSSVSADAAFGQGRRLEAAGRFAEAREAYLAAKDLDRVRFRAAEEFNGVIRSVAARSGAAVVPVKAAFEKASEHGLVGDGLMSDHLHPNVAGYFVMADCFFNSLRENRVISDVWDDAGIPPSSDYRSRWGFTAFDSVYASLCVRQLRGGWPFRPRTEPNSGLDDYRPADLVDSTALKILTGKGVTIEVGHLMLAERYEKQKAWEKAFREYAALVFTVPHETMFCEGAVRTAIAMKKPEAALPLLEESRAFMETVFADKWIGMILLRANQPREALPYLERARSAASTDLQLMQALARAYRDTHDTGNAEAVEKILQKLSPRASGVTRGTGAGPGERNRAAAARLLEDARNMLSKNDPDRALEALKESLALHETYQANSWIAQVYLTQNRTRDALPHLERAVLLKPDDPSCLFNLSAAYLSAGEPENAWRAALNLERVAPSFRGLARLKAKIKQQRGN
jgi:tetratricopeptide (TPR) repeat protein